MADERYDEIDRLFSRLDPIEPPKHFVQSVMARAIEEHAPARHTAKWTWLALDIAAALILAIAGFDVGQTLAIGAFPVLMDPEFISVAPTEWLLAVNDSVPYLSLSLALVSASAVVLTTRSLLHRMDLA